MKNQRKKRTLDYDINNHPNSQNVHPTATKCQT